MELYNFYQAVAVIALKFGKSVTSMLILSMLIGAGIWFALYLLQAFGLYNPHNTHGAINPRAWPDDYSDHSP